jgi:hypothetical protein
MKTLSKCCNKAERVPRVPPAPRPGPSWLTRAAPSLVEAKAAPSESPDPVQAPNLCGNECEGPPPDVDLDQWFRSLSDGGDPCPECGSLETWEGIVGGRQCTVCESLARSKATAYQAQRLRRCADQKGRE